MGLEGLLGLLVPVLGQSGLLVPVLLPTLVVLVPAGLLGLLGQSGQSGLLVLVPAGLLGLLVPLLGVARQGQQVVSKLRLVQQVAFQQVAFQEPQQWWLLELPYNL
jgi:uncharacterized RDD family membrane protein YckC